MPPKVLLEITLRSAAVRPPTRLLLAPPVMAMAAQLLAAAPSLRRPKWLPAITLLLDSTNMPCPAGLPLPRNPVMLRPRTKLPLLPAPSSKPLTLKVLAPSMRTTGAPPKSGSVPPSI